MTSSTRNDDYIQLLQFIREQHSLLNTILEQQRRLHNEYMYNYRLHNTIRRRRNAFSNGNNQYTWLFTTQIPLQQHNFEDVPVPATNHQISQSTEQVIFNESDTSMNQTQCPISMEVFHNGDRLLRIRHCGHIFLEENLRQWFQTRPTCPVCRHDIRENIENEPVNQEQNTNNNRIFARTFDLSSNSIDEIFESMFRNLSSSNTFL